MILIKEEMGGVGGGVVTYNILIKQPSIRVPIFSLKSIMIFIHINNVEQ